MADLPNLLFYGDNLDVLRKHVKDESVDLIYLDPPFNSIARTTSCSSLTAAKNLRRSWKHLTIRGNGLSFVFDQGRCPRWAQNPLDRIAFDQLQRGTDNAASAGPVIGAMEPVRDAVVNAEQSIFQGSDPTTALNGAAATANAAITDYESRLG